MQGKQILAKAAQGFQHRLAVIEEDIAPKFRVGGRDTGEIAKAAGGIFHHFALGHSFHVIRRVDDVVGDQMRQVGGDGQHQVVPVGRHDLDPATQGLHERG